MIPRARLTNGRQTQVVRGAYYIQIKLDNGWTIVEDVQNRLLADWIREPEPEVVEVIPKPKKKGRPKGSKNKGK